MAVKVEDLAARMIDYRLNILGIRVWEQSCQLVAKSGAEWSTIGPRWDLPVHVPKNAEELKDTICPLRLTAYQYCAESPGSDLAEVLNKSLEFSAALHSPVATAGLTGPL